MIKNAETYKYTCDACGEASYITTNQPEGDVMPFLCSCYERASLEVPKREGKYLYKMRPDTVEFVSDIIEILEEIKEPMTVRQMYYQLVNRGYHKTEAVYQRTQKAVLDARERGFIPFSLIADNTRSYYKPRTHRSLKTMLEDQKLFYRRDLWQDQGVHCEVWLEKESLRNFFTSVTSEYQVPLYVTKGFSSVSFIYNAAMEINTIGKPAFIYLFTDMDPSGMLVAKSIERRMREFGVKAHFERICLTKEQVEEYDLPTRPTKVSAHSKDFEGDSVEMDALHPAVLKALVKGCIERHVNQHSLRQLRGIEQAEKQTLDHILNNFSAMQVQKEPQTASAVVEVEEDIDDEEEIVVQTRMVNAWVYKWCMEKGYAIKVSKALNDDENKEFKTWLHEQDDYYLRNIWRIWERECKDKSSQ